MTLAEIINDISHYLRVRGTEQQYMFRSFLNDSILDFLRLDEWERCKSSYTLTLDGSLSYNLDTLLAGSGSNVFDPFFGEIALFQSGQSLIKKNYENYISLDEQEGYWAMLGNTIYIIGDGDTAELVYKSPGWPFPLLDTHQALENKTTKYYWDILQKMVCFKYLKYLGDLESAQSESQMISDKLGMTRQDENRIRHQGKFHNVSR
jgi:hypothetical protein